MFASVEYVAEQDIGQSLKDSLNFYLKGYKYSIKFANDIIIDKEINKGEQSHFYKLLR